MRLYEISISRILWGIEVSATGEFAGEQISVETPSGTPGFGWGTLALDLTDNDEFSGLTHFFIRFWGDNNATNVTAQAQPVRVYGTYTMIPEPSTLTLLLGCLLLQLRRQPGRSPR